MREMLADLRVRMDRLDGHLARIGKVIDDERALSLSTKQRQYEIHREQQNARTRREGWSKYAERLDQDLAGSYAKALENSEEPFRSGKLACPDPGVLVRRECPILREYNRQITSRRDRFLPLAFRDMLASDQGLLNDRNAARRHFSRLELLDPAIFQKTLVYAKKRDNRIDMRLAPIILIMPAWGGRGFCANPRKALGGGCLVIPSIDAGGDAHKRLIPDLAADYRWESALFQATREIRIANTLVGAFKRVRREWQSFPREKRERGYIHTEQSEATNWRRVYGVYYDNAEDGCERLMERNPDLYEAIIGKHIDLPEGVAQLQR